MGNGPADGPSVGGAVESHHHASLYIEDFLSIPSGAAIAVAVETDPAAAQGVGGASGGEGTVLRVFPDRFADLLQHLELP